MFESHPATLANKTLTTPTIASFTNATHDHSNAAGGGTIAISDTTGTLAETRGGTGTATYTTGDLLYASASNTLSKRAIGTTGQVLKVVAGVPNWANDIGSIVIEATVNTSMAVNTTYVINKAATTAVMTLPVTAALGEFIELVGRGATGWELAQNASQQIHFGNVDTTTGTGGKIESTDQNDVVRVICVTANTEWVVQYSIGAPTVT